MAGTDKNYLQGSILRYVASLGHKPTTVVRRGKDIVTDSPIKRRTDVSQEKLRLDIHHSP